MSDRIEDREAERVLKAQLERQRTEAKVASQKGAFEKVQVAQAKKAQTGLQQDRKKGEKQGAAAGRALAARSGIDNGLTAMRQLGAEGRMARGRAAEQAADKSSGMAAVAQFIANEKAASHAHTGVPVSGKGQKEGQGADREDAKQSARGESTRGEQAIVAQGGAAPLAPLSGTAGRASGAGGTTTASPSTQQIINEIVKRVHKGVLDSNPFIHIQLNQDVLGGASLTLRMAKRGGGLSLNIESASKEATDLLANGDNARSLAQQLAARDITLSYLKVGNREVIR